MPARRFLFLLPALVLPLPALGATTDGQATPPPAAGSDHHRSTLMGVSVTVVDENPARPPASQPLPRPALPTDQRQQGR